MHTIPILPIMHTTHTIHVKHTQHTIPACKDEDMGMDIQSHYQPQGGEGETPMTTGGEGGYPTHGGGVAGPGAYIYIYTYIRIYVCMYIYILYYIILYYIILYYTYTFTAHINMPSTSPAQFSWASSTTQSRGTGSSSWLWKFIEVLLDLPPMIPSGYDIHSSPWKDPPCLMGFNG